MKYAVQMASDIFMKIGSGIQVMLGFKTLYRSILLHFTYSFLVVISRLTCNLLFKTFKSFKP
jgi:hypothetical protein